MILCHKTQRTDEQHQEGESLRGPGGRGRETGERFLWVAVVLSMSASFWVTDLCGGLGHIQQDWQETVERLSAFWLYGS